MKIDALNNPKSAAAIIERIPRYATEPSARGARTIALQTWFHAGIWARNLRPRGIVSFCCARSTQREASVPRPSYARGLEYRTDQSRKRQRRRTEI